MTLAVCTDLITAKGTKVSIGDKITTLSPTYTEIGMIESIGEFGPEANTGSFTPIGTGLAGKYMGTTDNGEVQLTIAKTTTDTGLLALIAKQGDPAESAFKIELSETGAAGTGQKAQRYVFLGLVRSARVSVGSGDEVVKVSVAIPITGAIIEGAKVDGT